MTEEEKAAEYRRQETASARARLVRYRALKGSKTSYDALYAGTSALRRNPGWDPVSRLTPDEERTLGN